MKDLTLVSEQNTTMVNPINIKRKGAVMAEERGAGSKKKDGGKRTEGQFPPLHSEESSGTLSKMMTVRKKKTDIMRGYISINPHMQESVNTVKS